MISVTGVNQTLKALRQLEPKTAKEVGQEVSKVGRTMARGANAPGIAMTGWRTSNAVKPYAGSRTVSGGWPAWPPTDATSRRRGMEVIVSHSSAAGMIYEAAGSVNPNGRSKRGAGFISQLPPLTKGGKRPGRYLRRSVVQNYRQAYLDIEAAANKAADAVNRLMP
ncbi:MAG: hypothetical protein WD049_02755 [Candidatus Paceibacterota bacterium]